MEIFHANDYHYFVYVKWNSASEVNKSKLIIITCLRMKKKEKNRKRKQKKEKINKPRVLNNLRMPFFLHNKIDNNISVLK